ncbi:MAG TPA: phosphotransferase family protein [Candidatus Baltobacteraceae bacterium]
MTEFAERLQAFAARELGIREPLAFERILGGQSNPTWFVDAGKQRLVLRMQPPGELLPSAHALDRESRVIRALEGSGVAVPRVLTYSEDRSVVGTTFYLMERIDGRVFPHARLEGVNAIDRRAMYRSAAAMLAALHAVDWERAGLSDFGKHEDYFGRQVRRWSRQWEASRRREIPDLDRLITHLPKFIPKENPTVICHGDYRFGNLMYAPAATDVVGVLDWELSTLGDPMADVGYVCMPYHLPSGTQEGIAGLDHAALGIPSRDELVADYNAAAGEKRELLPFHIAFAFFRFAVIVAGIEDRAQRGNAAHPDAGKSFGRADLYSRVACELLGI